MKHFLKAQETCREKYIGLDTIENLGENNAVRNLGAL